VYVLNTHVHSDHITTGTALIKETSPHEHVKSVISKASGAKADIHLEDGDTIHFGSRYITAIATPGHSQGCMCFLLDDEKAVLTGDTLFVHGFGRTDIPGGDATVLYESITNKVFSLPDECTILPGHENSFFRNGKTYSTIGDEKRRNAWMVRPTDSEAAKKRFYAVMESISSQLSTPENLDTVMATNLRDGEKLK
jgi:sulfur dioxygenase